MAGWNFCSKADVQELHNIDPTNLLDTWSVMVEGLISEYMGSPALTSDTVYTETYSGNGTYVLFVQRPPIKSVTSVTIDESVVSASEYEVGESTITLLNNVVSVGHKKSLNLFRLYKCFCLLLKIQKLQLKCSCLHKD